MKKRYILTIVLLIAFIIVMSMVLTNNTVQFDNKIYNAIFDIRNDFFDIFFKSITKFGNIIIIFCNHK